MSRGQRLALFLIFAAATLFACAEKHSGSTAPPVPSGLRLQTISTAFSTPVFLTAPPGDFVRLFVVEKPGRIRIIKNGTLLTTPFLDIHSRLSNDSEQGLLGLAFDPNYSTNRRFYISYTDVAWNEHVDRYTATLANPDVADPASRDSLLYVPHPDTNHNGGMLAFGPDGMLFACFGDGGGGGDQYHHSQTTDDLLGSISRIDVRGAPGYVIPPDNPFVGVGQGELWDVGLRNPWRFSFDRLTGDLYIADVGQDNHEEIDISVAPADGKGANYGWNIMEAAECYPPGSACSPSGFTPPVLEYDHGEGCAVIGGYVYRGTALGGLAGTYFYGDNCAHWVRSFRYSSPTVTEKTQWPTLDPGSSITSFGEDAHGELYVLTGAGGVYKIVSQ